MEDTIAMVKLWHTISGVYIWEFFTTLEYEWNVIQGRLPYRWTIWIYSLARVATLLSLIINFVSMDSMGPIDCQVTNSALVAFFCLAVSASSLLIVLRIIAIWNRNRVVVATAISVWIINMGFLIEGIVRGGGWFGLSQFLWRQSVIWLFLATVAEVPPVVFVLLDLDDTFNLMFQPPSVIIIAIAATRIHRSLVDFASGSADMYDASFRIPKSGRTRVISNPLDWMEVAGHVGSEQSSTS